MTWPHRVAKSNGLEEGFRYCKLDPAYQTKALTMADLEVGMQVRVRGDLKVGRYGGDVFTPKMRPFLGQTLTVESKRDTKVTVIGSHYNWTPEMLERITPSEATHTEATHTLTPEQLAEGLRLVCKGWQVKILGWAFAGDHNAPSFTAEQVAELRATAESDEQRAFLNRVFGKAPQVAQSIPELVAAAVNKLGDSDAWGSGGFAYDSGYVKSTQGYANEEYTLGAYLLLADVDRHNTVSTFYTNPKHNGAWFNIRVHDEAAFRTFLQEIIAND
ncbi:hypothetical protein [Neolewinella maritima]|nr:hypothetical protein [Neolewinella maritima]